MYQVYGSFKNTYTWLSSSFLNLEKKKKNLANNGFKPKLKEFRATWTCFRFYEPIKKTQPFPGPACSQAEQKN